ncbi:MAG TPA: Spy/CpxP family protein refolding chaperone [Phycisphaerae bacterium]|nr:Spy/CpxP family protein refolding chaperone [Phycisphaerae bacterium]
MTRRTLNGLLAALWVAAIVIGWTAVASAATDERPKRAAPPRPVVFAFKHIPAESFMHTLNQLANNPKVRSMLEGLPIALNEPANAVVIIARPDAANFLTTIAKGLDRPNVFRQQAERRRQAERQRTPMMRPGPEGPMRHPMMQRGPEGAMRPDGRPEPGAEHPRRGMEPMARLRALTVPKIAEKLGLNENQVRQIRGVLAECRRNIEAPQNKAREAMKNLPPEERRKRAMEMMRECHKQHAEAMRQTHERIMNILTTDQREKARKMLEALPGAHPPKPDAGSKLQRQKHPGTPKGERSEKKGPASFTPAAPEPQARFWLVQDAGDRRWGRGRGGAPGRERFSAEQMAERRDRAALNLYFRLLKDPEVRAELELTPDQETRITELHEKVQATVDRIRDQAQLDFGAENPDEQLSPEERRARQREMRRAFAQAFREARPDIEAMIKEAAEILTPEQRDTLGEIARRRWRFRLAGDDLWRLTTPLAQKELGLTDQQVQQIKDLLKEAAEQMQKISEETFEGLEDVPVDERADQMRQRMEQLKSRYDELKRETREQVFAVLTEEQRPKAEAFLKGRPAPQPEAAPAQEGDGDQT